MIFSDLIRLLEAFATLIGLPFFTVLMGFFILAVELFLLGVFVLFAVWRIRKEMIHVNRKIDLLVETSAQESEKKAEKDSVNKSPKESEEEFEKEPQNRSDDKLKKKKYRYKWK